MAPEKLVNTDPHCRGVRRRLSPARRFICEMMHFSRKVPSVEVCRRMNVAAVAVAREAADPCPSWSAIFMKAFALVARRHGCLRQVYMSLPWAHLYEHPHSSCVLMIEREHRGERIVLPAKFRVPDSRALADLAREIQRHKDDPVERIGLYRRALLNGRLPWLLRRLQWWTTIHLSGFTRAKRLGTFGISSLGGLGARNHPIGPGTPILTYGPLDGEGNLDVSVVFDHRVMDGGHAARALADLETAMHKEILDELNAAP